MEGIKLSETSQTEKDKYCMASLRVEPKKYNKLGTITKKKQNKPVAMCRGVGGGVAV